MATINRIGYGQVEPNHLFAQRTGQIYAQLPAAEDIAVLENGQYVKYNYADNVVDYAGEGEWMLVFNEIKLYEDRANTKDFALKTVDQMGGKMYPRVFKTNVGDIYTTNTLEKASAGSVVGTEDYAIGDVLSPNAQGYLSKEASGDMKWQIVKIYTMPDGQAAVKVMRIA